MRPGRRDRLLRNSRAAPCAGATEVMGPAAAGVRMTPVHRQSAPRQPNLGNQVAKASPHLPIALGGDFDEHHALVVRRFKSRQQAVLV